LVLLTKLINGLSEKHYNIFLYAIIILLGLIVGIFSVKSPLFAMLLILLIVCFFIFIYIFFKKGVLSFQRIVISLLVASILFPPIRLPKGIPSIRVELIIIIVAWALLLLGHFAIGHPIKFYQEPVYKWFILFGLAILLSTTYGEIVKGYSIIGRDFWEIGKLLEYFLIFALVANLDISPNEMKHYYKIALVLFLCSAFFGIVQYLNLGNINATISPYYTPTQMRGLLVHKRIIGTTGNPNEFGAMMVLASSLAFSGILFFNKKTMRLFSCICFAVFVLSIVLTLSRSAIIAVIISICFLTLFKYPLIFGIKKGIKKSLVAIPIIMATILIIIKIAPEKFFFRISQLDNIWNATSWQARIVNWKINYDLWTLSPLFGWGPGKATMTTIVDNEWLLLLRRYGLIGVIIFILWFANFYFGLSKICRSSSSAEVRALTVALQATFLAYAVYMIPAAVYHSLQLMPILLIFLGLAYSQIQTKEVSEHESS
jgi:hypothetical protein